MLDRTLLLRALAPAAAVGIAAAAAAWGPWSPLALDRANARFSGGDVAGAIDRYEAAAEGWHGPATRAEAWRRAGMLRRGEGDVRGAVRDWEHAAELAPLGSARAAILVELALLYKDELDDPRACAEAFEQAAVESGTGAEDVAAAGCWAGAGNPGAARAALQRAESRPELRERAAKALAELAAVPPAVADAGG